MNDIQKIENWVSAKFTEMGIQKITPKKRFLFSIAVDEKFNLSTDPAHFSGMTATEVTLAILNILSENHPMFNYSDFYAILDIILSQNGITGDTVPDRLAASVTAALDMSGYSGVNMADVAGKTKLQIAEKVAESLSRRQSRNQK